MTFNETLIYNRKIKLPLGPYVSLRENKRIPAPRQEQRKTPSSMIINVAVFILVIGLVGMSVVSIPEPPDVLSQELIIQKVSAKDPGFMINLGRHDLVADMIEHLFNQHKVLVNFVSNGQELIVGPFASVDEVMDYLTSHNLAEHLSYVSMRNGKKVYYEPNRKVIS
jgi:hypothetical protein